MFKLHILEDDELDNNVIYVSLLKFEDTLDNIQEDMIQPDEEIMSGNNYSDQYDTRKFLKNYLDSIASQIKSNYSCIKVCYVRPASKKTRTGLSNYIDIIFKHPKDITPDEEEEHYKYSIRFSDHDPDEGDDLIGNVKIVGMKPKNFEKAVIKVLKISRADIQKQISDYEKERFGRSTTIITF